LLLLNGGPLLHRYGIIEEDLNNNIDLLCYLIGRCIEIMKIIDLTPRQLRRVVSIKEKLDGLNKELRRLLEGAMMNGTQLGRKHTMSAAVKRKIAAAQKARWAKVKRAT